jgi:hypothetical protein
MDGIVTSLWMLWAVCTAVLVALSIDRGLAELHETDQLFLTQSGTRSEVDQSTTIRRVQRLGVWINELWVVTSGLFLLLAAFSIYQHL